VRWRTVGRIAVGWVLTLPASAAVGAFAALLVVWFGNWGILVDAILAVAIIVGLFLRSRKNTVDSSNAMSEVADSGLAVKVRARPRRLVASARSCARRRGSGPRRRREKAARKHAAKEDAKAKAASEADANARSVPRRRRGRRDEHRDRLARLRPGVRGGSHRCAARRRVLRDRLRLLVRAGRAPVVAPAEFTDAITVISEKEARRAARPPRRRPRRARSPTVRSRSRWSARTARSRCARSPCWAGSTSSSSADGRPHPGLG
jgi:hypothetical protein